MTDVSLILKGEKSIAWARVHMGTLEEIRKRFDKEKPLTGAYVGIALHVTKETANLVRTLVDGGAQVAIAGCNPLSTQDDVVAALSSEDVAVFAKRGQTIEEYYHNLDSVIERLSAHIGRTLITIDDGLDLVTRIHARYRNLLPYIHVGTEETTTGVLRARAMEKDGALAYPVIAVNNNRTKHLFDNYYGTGQSTIDGIMRATGILLAGKRFVVVGYGDCGKGIALRAQGMGAHVSVVESDPVRALQVHMDGLLLLTISRAARIGEVFVTATGNKHVIALSHICSMRTGAVLANAGHFNIEIDVEGLRAKAQNIEVVRPNLEKFLIDGKEVYLCGEGRLVNLVCAEGHPSEVMDLSFVGQALAVEYGVRNKLHSGLHVLPESLDREIARLKLESLGLRHQILTGEQKRYAAAWNEGT